MENQKTINRNGATSPERPQTGGVAEISPSCVIVGDKSTRQGGCLPNEARKTLGKRLVFGGKPYG